MKKKMFFVCKYRQQPFVVIDLLLGKTMPGYCHELIVMLMIVVANIVLCLSEGSELIHASILCQLFFSLFLKEVIKTGYFNKTLQTIMHIRAFKV